MATPAQINGRTPSQIIAEATYLLAQGGKSLQLARVQAAIVLSMAAASQSERAQAFMIMAMVGEAQAELNDNWNLYGEARDFFQIVIQVDPDASRRARAQEGVERCSRKIAQREAQTGRR